VTELRDATKQSPAATGEAAGGDHGSAPSTVPDDRSSASSGAGPSPLASRASGLLAGAWERVGSIARLLASVTLTVAIWWTIANAEVFPPQVLPSPPAVWAALVAMATDGPLLTDLYWSARRAVSGFVLGSTLAILFGVLTARSRTANTLLEGTFQLIRPIPAIALVPLAIMWFGIDEGSKLFLVTVGVFFPVWITAHSGVSGVRTDYVDVARCLSASRRQTLLEVILPAALPVIMAGLRVGIATAFILIVAAEMTGATAGLGFRLDQARLFSQADSLFVALLMLGLLGAVADQLFSRLIAPMTKWSSQQRG